MTFQCLFNEKLYDDNSSSKSKVQQCISKPKLVKVLIVPAYHISSLMPSCPTFICNKKNY